MGNHLRVTCHRTGRVWYCDNGADLARATSNIRRGDSFTITPTGGDKRSDLNPPPAIRTLLTQAHSALAHGHAEDADLCALADVAEGYLAEALEMWPTD